jgi:hypothetical protein
MTFIATSLASLRCVSIRTIGLAVGACRAGTDTTCGFGTVTGAVDSGTINELPIYTSAPTRIIIEAPTSHLLFSILFMITIRNKLQVRLRLC